MKTFKRPCKSKQAYLDSFEEVISGRQSSSIELLTKVSILSTTVQCTMPVANL
jgi:hypothetical protein